MKVALLNFKETLFIFLVLSFFDVNAQMVTTIAGSSQGYLDGIGTVAKFNGPAGVAVDNNGTLYVADRLNHRIRKISSTGIVSTFAGSGVQGGLDGIGIQAQFKFPMSVAIDLVGNIYVADAGNHRIRKITSDGVVTTLAGSTSGFADGVGILAQFHFPEGIALDETGTIFISDTGNLRIRKITSTGVVTTLAGNGRLALLMALEVSPNFGVLAESL